MHGGRIVIAIERLIACALGEGDADAVEEHVLSCSRCAAIFEALVRLGPAVAELVRGGHAQVPGTRALVERLDAAGLITRRYALAPGTPVPCSVGANDIYTLTVYQADFTGVSRVDLVRVGERIPDIPFDAATGRVYILSPCERLRALPSMRLQLQLLAIEGDRERVLGDYILDHTGYFPQLL
jgi:hypothetical protein